MKRTTFILFTLMAVTTISSQSINVMSYNIRYKEARDKEQTWKHRKEMAAQAILFYDADLIGLQEALDSQVNDLNRQLSKSHESYGVGRENGKKAGEHMMVYYKKKRFTPIDKGTLWLSETPETPSIGWDAACKRTLTWIILYDSVAQQEVAFFNTHLDHKGKVAREEGSHQMMNMIQRVADGRKIILTGDFNAEPSSNVFNIITSKNTPFSLIDSRSVASVVYGPSWTFHGFGKVPVAERKIIDYIFYTGFSAVNRFGVLAEEKDGVYLSDHCPIVAQMVY